MFMFIQELLEKKITNFKFYNIYIYIPMMIQNHVKYNNYSIYTNMNFFQTNID